MKKRLAEGMTLMVLLLVLWNMAAHTDRMAEAQIKHFTAFFPTEGNSLEYGNIMKAKIAEVTGAECEELWLSGQTKEQALNSYIASGRYPDFIQGEKNLYEAEALIPIDEYWEEYPNIRQYMTNEQWEHFSGPMFTGFDTDRTMLRLSAMNLMLHSITHPEIDYQDSVSKQNQISDKFTMCLANPPFKGTVDAESINDNLKAVTNTKKTELLFLALFLRMLRKGGQCACIVPDGVLFGSSKAHKAIRKELVENHQLRAVISMPSGVFKPYAGVSTAVLVFTKTGAGGTENVWFYDMKSDGFSLDDKRSEVVENDIPDIVERFHHLDQEADRKRTEQSFFVPKQEIADNDYDLSINKYKKVEYMPVEYPSTTELMADLHELEMEINAGLAELEEML